MREIKIFQCIPAYKPAPATRLISRLNNINCAVLIDIEDSIQDVQHPHLNEELKALARGAVKEIISNLPDIKFHLRINSIAGNEYIRDCALLHKYQHHFESVFIPKVQSSSDIDIFCRDFPQIRKINLIIESKQAIDNLDEILNSGFRDRIDFVFFGNYDYHLDQNIFPVHEQESDEYWKVVSTMIKKVERCNLNFGNSPYVHLGNINVLAFSIMQLMKYCNRNFAMMSLHPSQTSYFQKFRNNIHQDKFRNYLNHKPFAFDTFTRNKQKGRSFAFENNRIITPQEYLLLLNHQRQ